MIVFLSYVMRCYDTVLGPYDVMAVPVQVLVCVGGFSVYTCCSIHLWCDQCVQQWHTTICPCIFDGAI